MLERNHTLLNGRPWKVVGLLQNCCRVTFDKRRISIELCLKVQNHSCIGSEQGAVTTEIAFLRATSAFSASLRWVIAELVNRRDAENAEVAQRKAMWTTSCAKPTRYTVVSSNPNSITTLTFLIHRRMKLLPQLAAHRPYFGRQSNTIC